MGHPGFWWGDNPPKQSLDGHPGLGWVGLVAGDGVGDWLHAGGGTAQAGDPGAEGVEEEIDDWGGEEGECLRDDEAADDGDAEGAAQLGAGAGAEGERKAA
jgi:hypothetical protein